MNELPRGWETCEVDKIFKSFGGGTPNKSISAYWGGDIPWLSSGDIKTERVQSASKHITGAGLKNSSANLCHPGSVVVVVRSGVLRHTLPIAVLDREATINQDIKCFDSGHGELNSWLALALRASAKDILALNREGTTVESVKYETLKKFELSVPPLAEQRQILVKLERLLGKVNACKIRLEKIPVLLKRFQQSILAAACSGRLTAAWRGLDDAGNGDELPKDWVITKLDSIGSWCSGGTPSRQRPEYFGKGVPWVKSGDLPDGPIKITDEQITTLGLKNSSAKLMPIGTISMAIYGATIGKLGVMIFPAATNQACANVIPNGAIIDARYLFYYLRAERQVFIDKGQGGAQPNISQEIVRLHPIKLPPLHEQEEIVRRVEELFVLVDQLEERHKKAQAYVDKLTQSILAKAFRGELVPQDPKDEPAGVLLERIMKQAKGEDENKKKFKRRRSKQKQAA